MNAVSFPGDALPQRRMTVDVQRPHRPCRLLAAVNAVVVTVLGIFVAVDYQREIARQVDEIHVAVKEETKTMLPADLHQGVGESCWY